MGNYNDRHAHPLDKTATREFTKGYVGVTKMIASFFEPFDRDAIAEHIISSYAYREGKSKYSGMTKEQIFASWKSSAESGQATHATIESFFQHLPPRDGHVLQPSDIAPYLTPGQVAALEAFDGWWLWRTEWRIADHKNRIVGVIDAVIYHPELDQWASVDWKTNAGDEFDSSTEKSHRFGITPLSNTWPDCDLTKGDWQQNMYAHITDTVYNMPMDRLFLVHMPSDLPLQCTLIEVPKQAPGMMHARIQDFTTREQRREEENK